MNNYHLYNTLDIKRYILYTKLQSVNKCAFTAVNCNNNKTIEILAGKAKCRLHSMLPDASWRAGNSLTIGSW